MRNWSGSTPTPSRPTSYKYASLSYVPAPVRVIQAGGNETYLKAHGLENVGGAEHLDDALAAYTHALLWYITGNQAHADKAIEIMNAWSRTLVEIKFDQPRRVDNNSPVFTQGKLQAGWGGSLFARAGEIIRYSGAGWSNNDIARFERMLTDVYLPLTASSWTNNSNWLMTFAEATISIGVFTNNRDAFNTGLKLWRADVPSTIYLPSDGSRPHRPHLDIHMNSAASIDAYWFNPTQYISGLQQETLRDLTHATMGLGAMANAAETAYIQGVDLYAEQTSRITAGLETNAAFVNAYLDEVQRTGQQPPSTWTPPGWPGAPGSFRLGGGGYQSGWLVAHHHYTTRTNIPLPQTTKLVQRLNTTATQAALHMSWEPLTYP